MRMSTRPVGRDAKNLKAQPTYELDLLALLLAYNPISIQMLAPMIALFVSKREALTG